MATISQLSVTNFKRIRVVRIDTKGEPLVQITGMNAQGKTSLLDALGAAIGGRKYLDSRPIRQGADKAEIDITLDDGTKIKRTITLGGGGGTLTVTSGDGQRVASPQTVLDRMMASLAFDPLAFTRMKPADQVNELKRVVGLDFSEIENRRKAVFDQRTANGRVLVSAKSRLANYPLIENPPAARVDIGELVKQVRTANEQNNAAHQVKMDAINARGEVQRIDFEVTSVRARLAELEKTLGIQVAEAERLEKAAADAEARKIDTNALDQQIEQATDANDKFDQNRERDKVLEEVEKLQSDADAMTAELEDIDRSKRDQLAAAKFPVEGLAFDDAGVLYQGFPLTQASAAESLRVSVGMALAMRPELKVLLIRDGSLLDIDNLAMIAAMADEAGGQVWVERVERGGEGIEIIDGEVAEAK